MKNKPTVVILIAALVSGVIVWAAFRQKKSSQLDKETDADFRMLIQKIDKAKK